MVTKIAQVKVSKIEAGEGFLVTCSSCADLRAIRHMRVAADSVAVTHLRSHGQLHPVDEDA